MFHFLASVHGVEYIAGGDTVCQGVSAVINGQVIDRLVQTAEYAVRVTKEQFEMTKTAVVAMSTGEQLPCAPSSRGCAGASHAYSWTVPKTMDCPLQIIRRATMTQESRSTILVDESAQIVLEITSSGPTEVGTCPGRWLKTTEPRILVVLNSSEILDLETVQPEEVDPFLALAMSRMYMEYWRDMQHSTAGDLTERQKCRRQLNTLQQQHTWKWSRENSYGKLEMPWKCSSAGRSSRLSGQRRTVIVIYQCMEHSPSQMCTPGYFEALHLSYRVLENFLCA